MMATSFTQIEPVKENVLPMRAGHKAKNLVDSFAHKAGNKKAIEKEWDNRVAELERATTQADSNRDLEGPFVHWVQFLSWARDAAPASAGKNQYAVMMNKCIELFSRDDSVNQSYKFAKICMEFADFCPKPLEFLAFLETHSIGIKWAIFWKTKSRFHELLDDFPGAEKALLDGIAKYATPIDVLRQRAEELRLRAASYAARQAEYIPPDSAFGQRRAFGGLGGSRSVVSSHRGHASAEPQKLQSQSGFPRRRRNAQLQIAQDTPGEPVSSGETGGGGWLSYGMQAETTKENTDLVGQWTNTKLPTQVPSAGPQKPMFQIYDDSAPEEPQQEAVSTAVPTNAKASRQLKSFGSQRAENPVEKKSFGVPKGTTKKHEPVAAKATRATRSTRGSRRRPSRKEKLMYDEESLQNESLCFEEIRAQLMARKAKARRQANPSPKIEREMTVNLERVETMDYEAMVRGQAVTAAFDMAETGMNVYEGTIDLAKASPRTTSFTRGNTAQWALDEVAKMFQGDVDPESPIYGSAGAASLGTNTVEVYCDEDDEPPISLAPIAAAPQALGAFEIFDDFGDDENQEPASFKPQMSPIAENGSSRESSGSGAFVANPWSLRESSSVGQDCSNEDIPVVDDDILEVGEDMYIVSNDTVSPKIISAMKMGIDEDDEESVALKIVHSTWEGHIYTILSAGEAPSERFVAEFFSFTMYRNSNLLALRMYEYGSLYKLMSLVKVEEPLALVYACELLRIVAETHSRGIIHCNIDSSNILLSNDIKTLMLCDMDAALDIRDYPADTQFTGTSGARVRCLEMLAGTPWSYQVDTYGICQVVHQMVVGQPLDAQMNPSTGRWKPRVLMGIHWASFFDAMLNTPAWTTGDSDNVAVFLGKRQAELEMQLDTGEMKDRVSNALKKQSIALFEKQK